MKMHIVRQRSGSSGSFAWHRSLCRWARRALCATVLGLASEMGVRAATAATAEPAEPRAFETPPAAGQPPRADSKQATSAPSDRDIVLKLAATRYSDVLQGVIYDATALAKMSLRLPPDSAPVTADRRSQLVQARRAREKLRDTTRDFRGDAARAILDFILDSLSAQSRSLAADLQLHAMADLEALAEVQKLLAERGPDKFASFGKAAHILQDLDSGDRGTRRKSTLKAIMALKTA